VRLSSSGLWSTDLLTARPALRSSIQLGIIRRPLRPDVYDVYVILSVLTLTTFVDVYSFNFPDDRPVIKSLGKHRIPPACYLDDEAIFLAYFLFVLETVQTALTGADVYFWFVDGFGNVERLHNSHYAPIDLPIIHAIISFVVQGSLCYRIWTLNKRSSKFCLVIGVVRCTVSALSEPPDSGLLHQVYNTSVNWVNVGWDGGKSRYHVTRSKS
jgi:hypothetical protein